MEWTDPVILRLLNSLTRNHWKKNYIFVCWNAMQTKTWGRALTYECNTPLLIRTKSKSNYPSYVMYIIYSVSSGSITLRQASFSWVPLSWRQPETCPDAIHFKVCHFVPSYLVNLGITVKLRYTVKGKFLLKQLEFTKRQCCNVIRRLMCHCDSLWWVSVN